MFQFALCDEEPSAKVKSQVNPPKSSRFNLLFVIGWLRPGSVSTRYNRGLSFNSRYAIGNLRPVRNYEVTVWRGRFQFALCDEVLSDQGRVNCQGVLVSIRPLR